jgi:hypothetical protein
VNASTTLSDLVKKMKAKCEESTRRRDATAFCECKSGIVASAADAPRKTDEYRTYKTMADFESAVAKVTCN